MEEMNGYDMNEVQIIDRAIGRVSKGWTRGFFANTPTEQGVQSNHPDACEWCLEGALGVDWCNILSDVQLRVLTMVEDEIYPIKGQMSTLPNWNDHVCQSKEQAVQVLKNVRAKLVGEGEGQ